MTPQREWTAEDMAYLREHYPNGDNEEIARRFGVSVSYLRKMCSRRGIRKTKEFRSNQNKATQFRKGLTPHNKGRRMSDWCSEEGIRKLRRTMFRKGHGNKHRALPLGSEWIRETGVVYVKVAMEGKTCYDRWKPKHQVIWERHNGKIPEGHLVIFKDGDHRNFRLENLILVMRGDYLKQCRDAMPEEIRQIWTLKGLLAKSINRYLKTTEK